MRTEWKARTVYMVRLLKQLPHYSSPARPGDIYWNAQAKLPLTQGTKTVLVQGVADAVAMDDSTPAPELMQPWIHPHLSRLSRTGDERRSSSSASTSAFDYVDY